MEDLATIFEEALRLTGANRDEYLDRVCKGNPASRQRVEGMIEAAAKAYAFFRENDSTLVEDETTVCAELSEGSGTIIGRYKLLQKIGEGGMGVVYMAEQTEPVVRKVALKIIKLGMDTRQVVARFEAERQALAMMDHPNIARVLDGGATESGRPYFVMELVHGVPITEFCDKNKLTAHARLNLFISICQAIQSAHQKGIIHRDIKPSNVLVTLHHGEPMAKVIDFGIAKATHQKLTEKTLFTNYGAMIGTPAYMSPEQAEMSSMDVDTRTDVYSLGVLLYELLTGTTPFPEKRLRSAGYGEMQRIIVEEEPEKPSTRLSTMTAEEKTAVARTRGIDLLALGKLLKGDLDWIVMKCLEKDRRRRYETASAVAADAQRYLSNEPVVARPPTPSYRLQKAFRRNKLAFIAAAAVTAVLAIGIVVSTWQAIRATRARGAEKEQRIAAQTERDKAQAAQRAEKQARVRADHLLYVANMNVAQQAWEQNNIDRLRQLLTETQLSPDRGFEWYYWQPQTHLALKTLRGHLNGVWAMALSKDGQRIVTGSEDSTAKLWEAASGRELLTLRHGAWIRAVAFSPDGQAVATGGGDSMAKVWEVASGRERLVLKGHTSDIDSVAFSPDGQRIVTGSFDQTAKVWEVASGKESLSFKGHRGMVTSVAFSPDGQWIATSGDDKTAKVWEAGTGLERRTLQHSSAVQFVTFSPDGQQILTGSKDKTAILWEAGSGKKLLTLKGHSAGVRSGVFSPDRQRIVTGSDDGTAKVWEAATGRELFTLKGHGSLILSVTFSADGQWILSGSDDNTVKLWDASGGLSGDETGRNRLNLQGHSDLVWSVAYSPDGRRIVTGSRDHTAKVWDATSGKELFILEGHINAVWSVAYAPDSRQIVTGSGDQTARVWDATSGKELLVFRGHTNVIISAAYSPDAQRIITASWDGTAKVWEAATGKELFTLRGPPRQAVWSATFSRDSQWIVTSHTDGTAMVWEATSGKELRILKGHSGTVWWADFSPDSQRIVTGSQDRTAKVWEALSGNELFTLKGHRAWVWNVTFSPDGQRILTGSDDETAKLWDAATGRELLTLKGHSDAIRGLTFSPDGRRIVTGSQDRTARVWEAAQPEQVATWQKEEKEADEHVAVLRREKADAAERERVLRAQDPGAKNQ